MGKRGRGGVRMWYRLFISLSGQLDEPVRVSGEPQMELNFPSQESPTDQRVLGKT